MHHRLFFLSVSTYHYISRASNIGITSGAALGVLPLPIACITTPVVGITNFEHSFFLSKLCSILSKALRTISTITLLVSPGNLKPTQNKTSISTFTSFTLYEDGRPFLAVDWSNKYHMPIAVQHSRVKKDDNVFDRRWRSLPFLKGDLHTRLRMLCKNLAQLTFTLVHIRL